MSKVVVKVIDDVDPAVCSETGKLANASDCKQLSDGYDIQL